MREQRIREATGIEPGDITLRPTGGRRARPIAVAAAAVRRARPMVARRPTAGRQVDRELVSSSWTIIDWATGNARGRRASASRVEPARHLRAHLVGAEPHRRASIGELTLFVLAWSSRCCSSSSSSSRCRWGWRWRASITGSVHALFVGTERVRQGDFTHRISSRSRDQLGELAESFNAMTASIEDLLLQAAEKQRLEEELRIAREIQMSLLPRGPLGDAGAGGDGALRAGARGGRRLLRLLPARRVALGVLIADVSGKGTSAALYMAELKGLMLSLSQIYHSPRQLLIEVNRIISDNLDSRSFITMTYAVVDLEARTLTYARAGHTPLIYLPRRAAVRAAQVLTPDGMVLGLRIDGHRANVRASCSRK